MRKKTGLKQSAAEFPKKPGIYFFKNSCGKVIYIGKARSLRERVRSYFSGTSDNKVHNILRETERIDFILTDSEREAAFLENNFIRQHQPKFNLRLKDDKSFPYLKLTVQDDYPAVKLSRKVEPDRARYFGPFTPAHQARKTIHLLNKYFGIRSCKEKIPGTRKRPCLEYDLKQCSAPCVGYISREDYRNRVQNALLFLEGKGDQLLPQLQNKMEAAASKQDFEQAVHWRDLIQTLEHLKDKPKLISVKGENSDIFGFQQRKERSSIYVFHMREGKVIESSGQILHHKSHETKEGLLAKGIRVHYQETTDIPSKVHLPFTPLHLDEISLKIKKQTGISTKFHIPQKGKKKRLVELASKNARMVLGKEAGPDQHLHQLQEQLGLPEFPYIIEGIDISNTGGDEAVGSLVVFEKGRPRKDLYRKYRIKSVEGPDDVRCIAEVVHRRYSRLQKEASPLPNLILIDGGKGQLNAARRALKELGLGNRPLISLAKREETIFSPRHWNGVQLNPSSPALRMLQFVRDEAHRFAVSYHRRRRSQKSLGSLLDHIQGIGPRRKSALLKKYRGLDEIKLAPEADLDTLVGKIAARRLKKNLDALDLESHKQPDNNR